MSGTLILTKKFMKFQPFFFGTLNKLKLLKIESKFCMNRHANNLRLPSADQSVVCEEHNWGNEGNQKNSQT